ncbi:MAG: tRNA dihydrouridine(20/20a) synthase DusA [Nevskiales bacterium]
MSSLTHRFCVAPMMDWTDRHCRFFLRQFSRHARLYTEMVTTGALLRGDAARHLQFHPTEHPLALQLGGAEPQALAACARLAEDWGYDEVNLNVGCPSDRVQSARFGACLMAEPALVGDCIASMAAATRLPVTVKCRIGIDDQEDYASLRQFVDTVADAGCTTFIVHARKAWLNGLSPKENREIPPLRYEVVHQLKHERPDLCIVLNGGMRDLDEAATQLQGLDGIMLGRAAYQNPYILAAVDQRFFADARLPPGRAAVLEAMLPYLSQIAADGTPLRHVLRHMLGLFQGQPGARAWRRALSEHATQVDLPTLRAAVAALRASDDARLAA